MKPSQNMGCLFGTLELEALEVIDKFNQTLCERYHIMYVLLVSLWFLALLKLPIMPYTYFYDAGTTRSQRLSELL